MAVRYEKIVEEDLNVGTAATWITNPARGQLRVAQVGIHSVARGQKAYDSAWTPGTVSPSSYVTTTTVVPDAALGDFVAVSHDGLLTSELIIAGHVSAADIVKVIIYNPTAVSVSVPAGTLRALVFPTASTVQEDQTLYRRLAAVGGGLNFWNRDQSVGYSGFDGPPTAGNDDIYLDDSDRTLQAMVTWLTGKATGASVLCVTQHAEPNCLYSEAFANAFQQSLKAHGHTVDVTGLESSWWPAHEPVNYDLLCVDGIDGVGSYNGLTLAQDKFDYVLARTSVLCNGNLYTPKYGLKASSGTHHSINQPSVKMHWTVNGPPQWRLQVPFASSWLGVPDAGGSWNSTSWALTIYTTYGVLPDDASWTMGGSRLLSRCALGDSALAPYHYRDDEDGMNILGLWQP